METLLHPAYFPGSLTMACLLRRDVVWEVWDNYQKQTFRNRCYICTDRGRLTLTVPIRHVGGETGRQRFRDVRIDNTYNWQRQHWRALETAYRSAPFFEYYESDLLPLFNTPYDSLLELDLASVRSTASLLSLQVPDKQTGKYETSPPAGSDARMLIQAKTPPPVALPSYHQVFEDRHGFIPNLSVLDLLFNEGPAAGEYLKGLQFPAGV